MSLASFTLGSRTAQALPSAQATLARLQLADLNAAAAFVAPPSRSSAVAPSPSSTSPGVTRSEPGREAVVGSPGSVQKQAGSASEPRTTGETPRNPAAPHELDARQVEQLIELAARDREVRVHEQAHQAAGGQYAGAVSYSYVRGPNGQTYATGGEVDIDVAPIAGDPAATIQKMEQVQRAALAPAEPSAQDRAVAAFAAQQILQARAEQARQMKEAERSRTSAEANGAEPRATEATEPGAGTRAERSVAPPVAAESGQEAAPGDQDPRRTRAVAAYQAMLELGRYPQASAFASTQERSAPLQGARLNAVA